MKYVKHLLTFLLVCVVVMSSIAVSTFAATNDVDAKKGKVTKITVTSPSVSTLVMKKGSTYTIKTKVETDGKDADKSLSYSSTNSKIVSVDSKGKLKAVKAGKVTITVKSKANSKIKDSFAVVVDTPVSKITLNKTSLSLETGKSATLKPTIAPSNAKIKNVKYSTSDSKIATVDKNGKVTAVKVGKATITVTATDGSDKKATCTVTVKPILVSKVTLNKTAVSLVQGKTTTLSVTVAPGNAANKKVAFTTSDSKIATVDKNGKITAVKVGKATITATAQDGSNKSAKCTVTVTPILVSKVELNKTSNTIERGKSFKLTPTVTPSNAANKTVKYVSSNSEVATVDNTGKVTAIKVGEVIIKATAQDGSKKYATCKVKVIPDDYYDPTDEFDYGLDNTENITEEGPSISDEENEYDLVWSDNFEGEELNEEDWNVELHDAGWVNSEWQKYVNDDKNIFLKDGNLVLRPTRHKGADGDTYESGRVNTQGKRDFTYGLFEARVKVPEGQGFLPAFWMMPTDENLYGQWPRCGEIDCMEVMGQDTTKAYGTIHYGNPHKENQGTKVLTEGNYSDEYHVFACEWEPDRITWYVDGVEYYTTQNWYSQTIGQGKKSYPAPFDQNFYMILNLAVGGSWVGNPDDTTKINPAAFAIDYVKVYQKESYDDNVTEPTKDPVVIEEKDEYINNGSFGTAESLTDDTDWKFLTALGGEATATIENNEIKIEATNNGTADYSVQLVQAKMPLKEGDEYEVSFRAKADSARHMNFAVKAPDYSYFAHLSKDVALGTDWETYTYTVKLTEGYETDANCRVEFNMGQVDSTATIHITDVSYKKTGSSSSTEPAKKVLADGNLIYNGTFDEGTGRLGYWNITNENGGSVSVTSLADGRMLKVNGTGISISQSGLAVDDSISEYLLSMKVNSAAADAVISGSVLGKEFSETLASGDNEVRVPVTKDDITNHNVTINFPDSVEIKIDNVRLEENCMIKNGSFNGGTTGYEWYADSSASATFVVDSLTETNAADITVNDTGDADWKIQLKQNNVKLEKGKAYKLTLKAKSSVNRTIRAIMQGGEAKGWPVYSGENDLELTSEYQTFEKSFKMTSETDPQAFLSICLGAVGGTRITTQHRVCIDDISLVEIDPSSLPGITPTEYDVNLLNNGNFGNGLEGWEKNIKGTDEATVENGKVTFGITDIGENKWDVELKQTGITIENGEKYEIKFTIESEVSRKVEAKVQQNGGSYTLYASKEISLTAGESQDVYHGFTSAAEDGAALFAIDMGAFTDATAGSITISNVSLTKVHEFNDPNPAEPADPVAPGTNLLKNADFSNGSDSWDLYLANWEGGPGADATMTTQDNSAKIDITNVGTADWNVKLTQGGINVSQSKQYKGHFKIVSTQPRTFKTSLMSTDAKGNKWYGGNVVTLGDDQKVTGDGVDYWEQDVWFDVASGTGLKDDNEAVFVISLGQFINDEGEAVDTPASIITISNVEFYEVAESESAVYEETIEPEEDSVMPEEELEESEEYEDIEASEEILEEDEELSDEEVIEDGSESEEIVVETLWNEDNEEIEVIEFEDI